MNAAGTWKGRIARRLVRHAQDVLHPVRPDWSEALGSELDHIPHDERALMWSMGCLWASYRERYGMNARSVLIAAGLGVSFGFLDDFVSGIVAAIAWPHWYTEFARAHRHLGLDLWSVVAETLPVALLAAGFGILLRHVVQKPSITLPCLSLGAWQLYGVGMDMYTSSAICPFSIRTLWESLLLFPTSSIAAIVLPAGAMLLGFRRYQAVQ